MFKNRVILAAPFPNIRSLQTGAILERICGCAFLRCQPPGPNGLHGDHTFASNCSILLERTRGQPQSSCREQKERFPVRSMSGIGIKHWKAWRAQRPTAYRGRALVDRAVSSQLQEVHAVRRYNLKLDRHRSRCKVGLTYPRWSKIVPACMSP